ncbi:MAG TPA: hypothetical protein VN948_10940 [Terriglobales bacterium]|nr:hypothetical protein [Terriglobales bacterium]
MKNNSFGLFVRRAIWGGRIRAFRGLCVATVAVLLFGGLGLAQDAPAATITGSGTTNFIPIWTNSTTLGNSGLFQLGTGAKAKVGIGTTKPASTLDVKGGGTIRGLFSLPTTGTATATAGFNSQPMDLAASVFNSSASQPVTQTFQWQAEPVGNDTNTATGSLNLLFGQGTTKPTETGFHIDSNGQLTFATGQTFPGAGTVTSVGSGLGLMGGPITTSGTLAIDTTVVPQLGTANTFLGNQTVNGNVIATQLVSLVSTFTPPLLVNSTTQVPNLNVSLLGGFSASAFPLLGSSLFPANNAFFGNQTVSGVFTSTTASGTNAASFVKGSSSAPTSAAAIQVENVSTLGEVAFLENGNASNPFSVLKLLQVKGATGQFLQCMRPDGTELCNIDNSGTFHSGSDFAEALPTRGARKLYEPGDVLVMANSGAGVEKTNEHYSPRVIGIFSTRPGFVGADKNGVNRVDKNDVPVAITGIVPAKVSAENGAVRVGDLLVTASTPGYAMKATDHKRMAGAIVGKALEPLLQGTGVIRVLVTMQ